MKRVIMLLAVVVATPLQAQAPKVYAKFSPVATSRSAWEEAIGNIAKAAEQVTEANYSYKPTPTVRSFGQLIGHVAGAQHLYCGAVLGEKTGNEDDVEKTATTKAALVAALKTSNDHCRKAYAVLDADAAKMVNVFGQDESVLGALIGNAMHDQEHYGNIVTYMRMLGMVPPSSQPRTP